MNEYYEGGSFFLGILGTFGIFSSFPMFNLPNIELLSKNLLQHSIEVNDYILFYIFLYMQNGGIQLGDS